MKKRMLVALLCLATTPLAAAPSAPSSSPNSLAEQTAEYISAIMAVWSDLKEQLADVLDVVDLLYGQQVVYYGKTTNKKAVLADKRRFMQRWPERRYAVRPLTLKTTCDATRVCAVSGIVDWSATNPATAAQARGSAKFYYRVLWSEEGAGTIIHEESKVLDRQTQAGAKKQSGSCKCFSHQRQVGQPHGRSRTQRHHQADLAPDGCAYRRPSQSVRPQGCRNPSPTNWLRVRGDVHLLSASGDGAEIGTVDQEASAPALLPRLLYGVKVIWTEIV